jgi:hypothetical protein
MAALVTEAGPVRATGRARVAGRRQDRLRVLNARARPERPPRF